MNLLLYIDPGTGSMLFSVIIGLVATLFFLGKAAIIKLKFIFSGKNKSSVTYKKSSIVLYCEGKQYSNIFNPIITECESRKFDITYFTSYQDDPVLQIPYVYIHGEYIGEGNTAIAKLNLLEADICVMTTPALNVYQLKRSKFVTHYCHILHAVGDATMYKLFGLDYFDSVLLSGEYQKKDIAELEVKRSTAKKELVTVGCTYLDVLAEKLKELPKEKNHQFTVLLSPSWGANGILSKYGKRLLNPLAKTGFQIIIRPHPQSRTSEKNMLETLIETYKENRNIEWDFSSDNIVSMAKADCMISDFSGIIFDYTFLCNRPFLYVNHNFDLRPYDAYDLDHIPWQFDILNKIGIELHENNFEQIGAIIQQITDNEQFAENRQEAKETAWQYIGESGKRTVDFLVEKQKTILKKNI